MNQEYFQRLTQIIKNVQRPLQAITELNIKTMRNLSYLKPDELVRIKPEDLFEKQVNLAIENGHKTLDYMQKTFEIIEDAVFASNDKLRETTDSMADMTYPGGNMGVGRTSANPSNMMMDMAQTVFDPMSNPMMNAAREAFNPVIPMEELARATSSRSSRSDQSRTKKASSASKSKSGSSTQKRQASSTNKSKSGSSAQKGKASSASKSKSGTSTQKRQASSAS
ncbi:hypothetical protein, partial [Legionella gresilensis]|uniref:hypothetical protein n=1 Tax=Legionella gresilensis TaxID=91823 RepID=UPI001040F2D9